VLVLLVERYLFVHRLPPTLSPPNCNRYGKKKRLLQMSWMLTLQRIATRGGGAHREEDSRRDGNKHGVKTWKDQDATLDLGP
jgi:hypothetical protein